MNKMIFGLALAASSVFSSACMASEPAKDAGTVEIKGQLKGLKDSLVINVPGQERRTIATPDGKFDFTVEVEQPTQLQFYTPASYRGEERIGFHLVAVPGEKATVSGDVNNSFYVTGSKFYKQYDELDRATEASQTEYTEWMNGLNSRMAAGESQEALMKEYQEKAPAFQEKLKATVFDLLKQHPDYEASATLIPQLQSIEDMRKGIALLAPSVRDGRMKAIYEGPLNMLEQQAKADSIAAIKQAAGVEAPDFTLNDINGKPLKLSSLRGKYVILDFWGSWCGWCIKGFPEMKEYYKKYAGKFEILGVDCNDTEDKWKASVEKNELPWLHVYNPRDNRQVLDDYAIQGFPTKIIIGPDGKIVKTVVGEDPSFYTFLDETFGK